MKSGRGSGLAYPKSYFLFGSNHSSLLEYLRSINATSEAIETSIENIVPVMMVIEKPEGWVGVCGCHSAHVG